MRVEAADDVDDAGDASSGDDDEDAGADAKSVCDQLLNECRVHACALFSFFFFISDYC